MSAQTAGLAGLLTLKDAGPNRAGPDLFQGPATPGGLGRVYGGQVLGQAIIAASRTVAPERPIHSAHAAFLRAGDATRPVSYQVERERDGKSFSSRRVLAEQGGETILRLAASFHRPEPGYTHQPPMPKVPPPEDLPSEVDLTNRLADKLPPAFVARLTRPNPIEMRPVGLPPPFGRENRAPLQHIWIRAAAPLGDSPVLHRAALAYLSDYGILAAPMLPYGTTHGDPEMQFASLDHAIWFHQDARADEWLLFEMDGPWAGGARGLALGRIYRRDGVLAASIAQEGLTRRIKP